MVLPQAKYKRIGNRDNSHITPKVINFFGLNQSPTLSPGEIKSMLNCSSDNYPCVSNRSPRTASVASVTTPNGIFSTNGKLCYVDGTSFIYDGVSKVTVTSDAKSIVDFNGTILIFPDKKFYTYGTNTAGTIGTGTYPTAGSCPDMDYICTYQNRVFGCKGNVIYASKFEDYTNWTTFAVEDTDAVKLSVYSAGSFTGITSYSGHVVLFKSDFIYELYGDVPSNFTVKLVAKKGCIDGRSICEVNGSLFFLAKDGFNIYNGGIPRLISKNLNEIYTNASAETDGSKYYVCLYNNTSYILYVYDTFNGVWHKEDVLRIVGFTYLDGYLYSLTNETTSRILKFRYGTETITGSFETEIFDETELTKKYYSKIRAKMELPSSTSVTVSVSCDGGAYSQLGSAITTAGLQSVPLEFIPKRCNNFQIKFDFVITATAISIPLKVYGIEREFVLASDSTA